MGEEPQIWGDAFAPLSSRMLRAQLSVADGEPQLINENGEVLFHGAYSLRERGAGGVEVFEFGADGWRFETSAHDEAEVVFGPTSDSWLHKMEAWHPRLAGILALALFGAFAIWKWGLGLLVAAAISVTPDEFVAAIDRGNLSAIDRLMAKPSNLSASKQQEITQIFEKLTAEAPPAPFGAYKLQFRSIEATGPNAFALPGGTMVMTDQLVERFDHPDIIAGVLGHELAHVSQVHGLKRLYRSLSTYMLIALIVGDVGPVLDNALLEGGLLLSLANSRAQESEADAIGIETAHRAGFNPAALAKFFDELAKEEAFDMGWYSTHPNSRKRMRDIERLAKEAKTRSGGT